MAVTTPSVPATATPILNTTGQLVDVAVTGGTITGILVLPTPAITLVAPAVPASTVTATNSNAFPVAVTMAGGTMTHQAVNAVDQFTNQAGATLVVPAGGTIAITYSVAPTWTWQAAVAGFAGTSIPSPSSVPLPPSGAAIQLVYSVAPTWAWTAPLAIGYTPGYSGMNQAQGSQITQLPWAAHAVVGLTGLGVGVDN
jgi:hypothetical protein